jgi:hypothetical protein
LVLGWLVSIVCLDYNLEVMEFELVTTASSYSVEKCIVVSGLRL